MRLALTWAAAFALSLPCPDEDRPYPWLPENDSSQSIANRIEPPEGFERRPAECGSFASWLRGLPLKPGRPAVRLFDGRAKLNQCAHHAVVDMDVGRRDLQQCADAVMRLRAEYLRYRGRHDRIRFRLADGSYAGFASWASGARPRVSAGGTSWSDTSEPDWGYRSFRRYLDFVFAYANTWSLSRQMEAVAAAAELNIGDVFIRGGFPGHCAIVVDMARHRQSGERIFLLAQGYMPAQDVHVLRNPLEPDIDPWFSADFGERLVTPTWTFRSGQIKRFAPGE